MDELIKQLALAREVYEALKARKSALVEDALAKTAGYSELVVSVQGAKDCLEILESKVRDLALQAYAADQNKKPHAAVQIKVFKNVYIPNVNAALEWCLGHFTPALVLDTKAFSDAAKSGTIPAELATVTEEPRVNISTNLDKFLETNK